MPDPDRPPTPCDAVPGTRRAQEEIAADCAEHAELAGDAAEKRQDRRHALGADPGQAGSPEQTARNGGPA